VKAANDYIDKNHESILSEWIAITEINAPSKHEQERAKFLENLLRKYKLPVSYDSAGNVTRIADQPGAASGQTDDVQCFSYDYLRRAVRFPALKPATGPRRVFLVGALNQLRGQRQQGGGTGSLEAVGSFVGRDAEFYEPEVALRNQKVVVVHGPAGCGKTELAKAFGRWWQATGGVERPEWVIFHSFEPGVASFGLEGVISAIALEVYGVEFAQLDNDERRGVVVELLREHRLLLIWDNFESVQTMVDPAGSTPGQAKGKGGRRSLDLVSDGGGGRPCRWLSSTPVAPKTRQRSAPLNLDG